MRFLSEVKGISSTRVRRCRRSSTPRSRAALRMATSVGRPTPRSPLSSASEHTTAASNVAKRSAGRLASKAPAWRRTPSSKTSKPPFVLFSRTSPKAPLFVVLVVVDDVRPLVCCRVREEEEEGHQSSASDISFKVKVPVLSTQTTSAQPRASTAGRRLTTAFRLAMRMTPRAKVTATQMGKPSGMAATAKDTPMVKTSRTRSPRTTPMAPITQITHTDANDNRFPRSSMPRCSGVRCGAQSFISLAVRPNSVCGPVATTNARHRPRFAKVPMNSTVSHSDTPKIVVWAAFSEEATWAPSPDASAVAVEFSCPVGLFFPRAAAAAAWAPFRTGSDSPERLDSSSRASRASRTRQSAGTLAPATTSTMSPGTSSRAKTVVI
mmetsp:Transcript_695/g.2417  ORF Transcript_695/g.2417 Transcript_695/m.2417 type:complete len:380 (-) Transcript_695:412-1551(-)